MSGTRTAVAVLAATVVAGGVLVRAGQTPAPAAPARGTAPASAPRAAAPAQTPIPSQTQGQTPSGGLPLTPTIRDHGSSITPAFEGWFHGKDGFDYVMAGYFNRNIKEEFDIPIGPNNHIDPGGPDQGQPTHFLLGRNWGVLTIKLPKDFGAKKLVWTLVVNGQINQITLHTPPVYIVEPYGSSWNDNKPPVLKISAAGPTFTGPPIAPVATYSVTMPNALPLTAWITDDAVARNPTTLPGGVPSGPPAGAAPAPGAPDAAAAPGAPAAGAGGGRGGRGGGRGAAPAAGARGAAPAGAPGGGGGGGGGRGGGISVTWTKYRGPGAVTFANAKPAVDAANGGKSETTATFDTPGEYVLRLQGNDQSGDGGGGEQCCWTNGKVNVTVKPAAK